MYVVCMYRPLHSQTKTISDLYIFFQCGKLRHPNDENIAVIIYTEWYTPSRRERRRKVMFLTRFLFKCCRQVEVMITPVEVAPLFDFPRQWTGAGGASLSHAPPYWHFAFALLDYRVSFFMRYKMVTNHDWAGRGQSSVNLPSDTTGESNVVNLEAQEKMKKWRNKRALLFLLSFSISFYSMKDVLCVERENNQLASKDEERKGNKKEMNSRESYKTFWFLLPVTPIYTVNTFICILHRNVCVWFVLFWFKNRNRFNDLFA